MNNRLKAIAVLLLLCPAIVSASFLTLGHHKKVCSDIESHSDQCAFVMSACHGFSGAFLRFYYCSTLWKPLCVAIMILGLLMLFGAVSVVAADFFCPNLQTISSRLQLSESMAGVTILAFGNGSPDLFSTFTAMNTGSGSLAIGELIGAAFFIVSVVSGCMGIIQPFQSKRITFMRDASFLTGAIMILTWIVYHQRICWYHGLILIGYYVTYVIVVVMGAYRFPGSETPAIEPKHSIHEDHNTQELLTETSRLLQSEVRQGKRPPRLDIPVHGFQLQEHLGRIIRPVSPNSSHLSRKSSMHMDSYFPRTTSTNGSISSRLYRHAMSPRVGMRTSLFSAIEFQEQVASIKRANSTHILPHRRDTSSVLRHRHTQASVPCISAVGRLESVDHLSISQPHQTSKTPESSLFPSHQNNHTPHTHDDYFTYISAAIQQQQQQQQQESVVPQIRLAPPSSSNLETKLREEEERGDFSLQVPIINESSTKQPHTASGDLLKDSISISLMLDDVYSILFPTLQDWSSKTLFAKLSAAIAVPLVLIFTLTLPVAEGSEVKVDDIEIVDQMSEAHTPQVIVVSSIHDAHTLLSPAPLLPTSSSSTPGASTNNYSNPSSKGYLAVPSSERSLSDLNAIIDEGVPHILEEEEIQLGWCRWLVATQAICATTFVTSVMALNGFVSTFTILFGFFLGCVIASIVLIKTNANEPPKWHWMLSFVGFVIALNWIFLLANEMVGLLQALGAIYNVSEAIMGLTIFALGNSIGDLVANTAIARMGLPTMAISACYAGPLLNMVLGVGISSTYQAWITGKPYELAIAPTILISSFGLITVLLSTLIVVNINGYHITKELGWWMIIVYATCTIVNMLIEFRAF
ncbi:Sodium/calcium exchanger protein-domain-containing protein [Blakeslea trispora]|nr:Sodium/calcium exchanger protein-domain-containing protein [Blakeslea trispora]